jgi:glutathione peroxidase
MKTVLALSAAALLGLSGAALLGAREAPTPTPSPTRTAQETAAMTQGVHAFTVKTITGTDKSLADYSGKVLLIVNVASECGFTPQYKDLEALYLKHKDHGFVILAFPSNDFHHQEPGTDAEIKTFCERNYFVTFDLFSKIEVKGEAQAPLYRYLTTEAGFDGPISWNFNKFLVGRDGKVIERWGSTTKPMSTDVVEALEKALK